MQIEVEKESASAEGAVVTCFKLDSYPVTSGSALYIVLETEYYCKL